MFGLWWISQPDYFRTGKPDRQIHRASRFTPGLESWSTSLKAEILTYM